MAGNRKATEAYILKYIKKITGTEFNVNLYKEMFKSLNDKEFKEFMISIRDGKQILQIIAPHDKGAVKIDLKNNLAIGKELGHDFFQHVYIGPTDDAPKIKTKYTLLVHLAPMRRMKQTVAKGISVAENDKKRDSLTGQVSGSSKSSSISYPEVQLLLSMGMEHSIKELIKYRGGDEGAMAATKQSLLKYGRVNSKFIDEYSTGVESTKTLKSYFNSMHFKINL